MMSDAELLFMCLFAIYVCDIVCSDLCTFFYVGLITFY